MPQQWIIPPHANVIEPALAPMIYANGETAVEWLANGDVCFHLTQRQLPLETAGGEPQAVVVAHVIKPLVHLPLVMASISECLRWHFAGQQQPLVYPHRPVPGGGPFRVVS